MGSVLAATRSLKWRLGEPKSLSGTLLQISHDSVLPQDSVPNLLASSHLPCRAPGESKSVSHAPVTTSCSAYAPDPSDPFST